MVLPWCSPFSIGDTRDFKSTTSSRGTLYDARYLVYNIRRNVILLYQVCRCITLCCCEIRSILRCKPTAVSFFARSAREWVKDALGNGGLCWVEEANFRNTVNVLLRQAPEDLGVVPRFVFATSDDAHFLEATKSGNAVPVFTLDDVSLPAYVGGGRGGGGVNTSASAAGQSITADEVSAALPAIDVAVCSRAALLMLNYFSTYSALIKAKAKAQPDFVRGLYWADPPALSSWWFHLRAWLRKNFRSS